MRKRSKIRVLFIALIIVFALSIINTNNYSCEVGNSNESEELIENKNLKTADSELTVITPENITYTSPMDGYYPGTYGFECDENGDFPKAWVEHGDYGYEGRVYVVDSNAGHNKTLFFNDPGGPVHLYPYQDFSELQTSGTIELWVYYGSHNYHTSIWIRNATDHQLVNIQSDFNEWKYYDGTTLVSTGLSSINQWFRVSINFSGDGTYGGLSANSYKFNIYNSTGALYFESPEATYRNNAFGDASRFQFFTGYTQAIQFWVDGVGYSWDENYDIGDNSEEGLLLSFESECDLAWTGYSLDGQTNITILGNTTIPLPNGVHTIQVFGIDSNGYNYQSQVRTFMTYEAPIPPTPPGDGDDDDDDGDGEAIPGYNVLILIGFLCVISIIITKKRKKALNTLKNLK